MLGESGIGVTERQYFKAKPSVDEVRALAAKLPGGAADLLSKRSRRYAELGLADKKLGETEIVALLATEPGLWRRPVIVRGDEVIIGFDQKRIQALLA